MTLMRSLIFHI